MGDRVLALSGPKPKVWVVIGVSRPLPDGRPGLIEVREEERTAVRSPRERTFRADALKRAPKK